eukprot:1144466-Pelagomonas_calceolata.AAC.1
MSYSEDLELVTGMPVRKTRAAVQASLVYVQGLKLSPYANAILFILRILEYQGWGRILSQREEGVYSHSISNTSSRRRHCFHVLHRLCHVELYQHQSMASACGFCLSQYCEGALCCEEVQND